MFGNLYGSEPGSHDGDDRELPHWIDMEAVHAGSGDSARAEEAGGRGEEGLTGVFFMSYEQRNFEFIRGNFIYLLDNDFPCHAT